MVPSFSDLLRLMNSCNAAALNASKTRWLRPFFMAVGSREVTNLARSVFLSISVTSDTRGRFCAADLYGMRKLQVELGLEENKQTFQYQFDKRTRRRLLYLKNRYHLGEMW